MNNAVSVEQLKTIDRVIRSAKRPTYALIADELDQKDLPRSKRTILRCLEYMRREYGAPAVNNRRTTNPDSGEIEYLLAYEKDWDFRVDEVTSADIKALEFAKGLLEASYQHPAAADVEEALNKLVGLSGAKMQADIELNAEPFEFAPLAEQKIERHIWQYLVAAARENKCVEIKYRSDLAWEKKARLPTTVKPYALANLGGTWYLLGSGIRAVKGIQQYHLSRIQDVKILDQKFHRPAGLDIKKILSNTFRSYIGDPEDLAKVKVRFSADVAPLVLEHRFHPKQKESIDKQKRLTLTFPVTRHAASPEWLFYHVRSWLLGWGANVEVLAPKELRDWVEKDAKAIVALYSK